MKILHRYIAGSFLSTFGMTLLIFTFVMSLGGIFKITDLIAKGMPAGLVAWLFVCGIPSALSFAIPVSALTASLLVFGRLSSDGEITAMKACGIGMWRIVSRPLVLSLLLVAICLYINNELAPAGHMAFRTVTARMGMEKPLELLEEGRFLEQFPGISMYIGRRRGHQLTDIRIYDNRTRGVRREITAKTGTVSLSEDNRELIIDLRDVRIDPATDDYPGPGFCDRWPMRIPNLVADKTYKGKVADMSFQDLVATIGLPSGSLVTGKEHAIRDMRLRVELNKRIALSVACFAFVLLGIPLGIKAHRRESSVGVGISLLLVFNFYLFLIVANTLCKRPELRPDLITWVPVALSLAAGLYLMARAR